MWGICGDLKRGRVNKVTNRWSWLSYEINTSAAIKRWKQYSGLGQTANWQLRVNRMSSNTAFLKLWSADHKWSSGSALVVLLDWTLVQKRQKKSNLRELRITHYSWESQTEFGNYIQQASLNFLSQDWHFMNFTTLPTLLSATKEGFSAAKTCFEHCLGQA